MRVLRTRPWSPQPSPRGCKEVYCHQPCSAVHSSGPWPNIRPVTNSRELLNGTILNGSEPPTASQLTSLLESKVQHIFGE